MKTMMGEEGLKIADVNVHELRKGFAHFVKIEKRGILKAMKKETL